jgi:hypothetical protein
VASAADSAYIGWVDTAQVGTSQSIGGGFYGRNYGSGIIDSGWHYIVLTYSGGGDGTASLFVDGVLKVTEAYTPTLGAGSYMLGKAESGTAYWFNGSIDDVKIWDYALTPRQIAIEYNQGAPVGYWKFDEGQGETAYDYSPAADGGTNGNDGTVYIGSGGTQAATTTAWTNGASGKTNSSLNFDGSDDYVDVGDISRTDIRTISFWVKPNDTTEKFVELSASDNVEVSGGTVNVTGFGTDIIYVDGVQTSNFPDNNWHHVIVVSDSDLTANTVEFGRVSSTYLNGQIDEVKIWNYVLTPAEVRKEYNGGFSSYFR